MKFCKKCQIETDRHKSGKCIACKKASSAAWYKANTERNKATKAAWTKSNIERHKANCANWYKANSERAKANVAAWQKANPEKVNEYKAAWEKANPEQSKEWRKANPEKRRIQSQNREARKRVNGGKLSSDLSAKLFKLQRGKCPCCKQPLGDNFHLDHIVPIKLGGANEDWNIQLLRATCNMQKNAKHPVAFMQQRGFLL